MLQGGGLGYEVSPSEVEAVKRLFASLSKADAEAEAKKENVLGLLPLHMVARFAEGRYAKELFTAVFNAYPSAAKVDLGSHALGYLPLHIVARCMASKDGCVQAMQMLLAEYPEAALESTPSEGKRPLNLVAEYITEAAEALEAIQLLLETCPQAAKEKQKDGWLPLHAVARHMGGAEGLRAMQLLLKEHPQATKEKQKKGKLPIHCMCKNKKGTLDMVRELLSAYPQSIDEKDGNRRKPAAAARSNKCLPADAIDFLRRAEQGKTKQRHRLSA
jgi:hypothetical protein